MTSRMTAARPFPYLLLVGTGRPPAGCLAKLSDDQSDFLYEEAEDADEAIARAAERRPALILLDLHGHEQEGIEMCRQLVASDVTSSIPILVIAGDPAEPQYMIELRVRPCSDGTLDQEIHRILHHVH